MKKTLIGLFIILSTSCNAGNEKIYLDYCMAGFMDMLSVISPAEVSQDKEGYKKQALQYREKACPVQYKATKKDIDSQTADRVRYLACFRAMNGLWTLATKKKYMDKKHSDYAVNTCNSFKTRDIKSIMGF
jgi:hypothetical protein